MKIDKISALVQAQFPDFFKEDGQNFLSFMEAYYAYMETDGGATDAVRKLESYRDIASTTEEFIDYFFNTLLPSVPVEVLGDKKLMAKYVKEFNQSRGTLAAYKLMFRAIYNEDIELNYPSDNVLKLSTSDWRIDRYLITNYNKETFKFIGKTIKGHNSSAEALVEDVLSRTIRGRHMMQLLLSNIKGTFSNLEPIKLKYSESSHSPTVDAGVHRVDLIASGGGYAKGDVVELISSERGKYAKVVVTDTQNFGGALLFNLEDGGSGYGTSTDEGLFGDTDFEFIGGDGSGGGFVIENEDLYDTFSLVVNANYINETSFDHEIKDTASGPYMAHSISPDAVLASDEVNNGGVWNRFRRYDYISYDPITVTIAGTPGTYGNPPTLTGVGTSFTTQFRNGDVLCLYDGGGLVPHHKFDLNERIVVGVIDYIISDSQAKLHETSSSHFNGQAWWNATNVSDRNNVKVLVGRSFNRFGFVPSSLANTSLSQPNYGFKELGQAPPSNGKYAYRDQKDAVLKIGHGSLVNGDGAVLTEYGFQVGDSIYSIVDRPTTGSSTGEEFIGIRGSSANGIVTEIISDWNGSNEITLKVDGFGEPTVGQMVALKSTHSSTQLDQFSAFNSFGSALTGDRLVGGVISYSANTVGHHIISVSTDSGKTQPVVDDEIVGMTSGAFGVVKHVYSSSAGVDVIRVTANNSSTIDPQKFNVGPMKEFIGSSGGTQEDWRYVGDPVKSGNIDVSPYVVGDNNPQRIGLGGSISGNTDIENIYSTLSDAFDFAETTIGSIGHLSHETGGTNYLVPPEISVRANDIAVLGINESYLTLTSPSNTWSAVQGLGYDASTSGAIPTGFDTNDRILQANTYSSGYVKGGEGSSLVSVIVNDDGHYEAVVRVWQDQNQREPDNKKWQINSGVDIAFYSSSGGTPETDPDYVGQAFISKIEDRGVLGKNAVVTADVSAEGAATGIHLVDSGFSYTQNEKVRLGTIVGRENSVGAEAVLTLSGAANSEGYHTSSSGQLSSKGGIIQDGHFYQEFSYELESKVSLNRYRDIALKLCHPAGQILFSEYSSTSDAKLDLSADAKWGSIVDSSHLPATGSYAVHKTGIWFLGSGVGGNPTFSLVKGESEIVGTGTTFTNTSTPNQLEPLMFPSDIDVNNTMQIKEGVTLIIKSGSNFVPVVVQSIVDDLKITLKDPWDFDTLTNVPVNSTRTLTYMFSTNPGASMEGSVHFWPSFSHTVCHPDIVNNVASGMVGIASYAEGELTENTTLTIDNARVNPTEQFSIEIGKIIPRQNPGLLLTQAERIDVKSLWLLDDIELESYEYDNSTCSTNSWEQTLNTLSKYGVKAYFDSALLRWFGNLGCFFGGEEVSGVERSTIEAISINNFGTGQIFGDLTMPRHGMGSCSNGSRGINAGGYGAHDGDPAYAWKFLDYITFSSFSNATPFGDVGQYLAMERYALASCCDGNRGLFAGGFYAIPNQTGEDFEPAWSGVNTTVAGEQSNAEVPGANMASSWRHIDYINTSSTSVAGGGFGHLIDSRVWLTSCSNNVRGIFAGGTTYDTAFTNRIEYVTIASLGDGAEFGDLTKAKFGLAACSSSTRGIFAGGRYFDSGYAGGTETNTRNIDYITMDTTADATDFGDLVRTDGISYLASCSNTVKGVFAEGRSIEYIQMDSIGSASVYPQLDGNGDDPLALTSAAKQKMTSSSGN